MKVLYFTNIPVPYRMDFFNELGELCDLTVLMETEVANKLNSEWMKDHSVKTFKYVVLPKIGKESRTRINYGYSRIIKSGNFDVIVVGTYYSLSAMLFITYLKLHKISFILNSDGGFIKPDNVFMKKLKTTLISSAKMYISTGNGTSKYLENYGADSKEIYIIPFTSLRKADLIERVLNVEEKHKIRESLLVPERKMIVFVGQFIYRKGVEVLLKALANCDKEMGVYIIGGEPTEQYKELAAASGNRNIHFISFLKKDILLKYYQAADLFVLPTREDIWGLVVNEAMGMGLPVISTERCLAALELVSNGMSGWIVPVDNVQELAKAIERSYEDENKLHLMQSRALDTIKKYTIENMAQRHIDIFEKFKEKCNEEYSSNHMEI